MSPGGATIRVPVVRSQDRSYEDRPHLVVFDQEERLALDSVLHDSRRRSDERAEERNRERRVLYTFGIFVGVSTVVSAVASVASLWHVIAR